MSALLGLCLLAAAAGGAAPSPRATVPPPDLGVRIELSGSLSLSGVAPADDREAVHRLFDLGKRQQPVSADDVGTVESLVSRYPREAGLADLREALLLLAANQAGAERRFSDAAGYLHRVTAVAPSHVTGYVALANLFIKQGDWSQAEAAARSALTVQNYNGEAATGLAYALMREDENEEAVRVLEQALLFEGLNGRTNTQARRLLDHIRRTMAQERDLSSQRLAHFTLRFDGTAHEAVGRHVLDVLEEQFIALSLRFGHQPLDPIPVILLTGARYYDGSTPGWSGGEFDAIDGRIRVPIQGLAAARLNVLDSTLVHELTHVFVADATGNLAPHELQEGLAQLATGDSTASFDEVRRRHPPTANQSVHEFYRSALSFAEYLMAQGGQSTLNAALMATGETGDLNRGFQQAYGRSYDALRAAWMEAAARP